MRLILDIVQDQRVLSFYITLWSTGIHPPSNSLAPNLSPVRSPAPNAPYPEHSTPCLYTAPTDLPISYLSLSLAIDFSSRLA